MIEFRINFDELKANVTKLEDEIHLSRTVNFSQSNRRLNVDQKYFGDKQYCRRESFEILGTPLSLKNIHEEIDACVDSSLEEDRQCLSCQRHSVKATLK